MQRIVCGNRGLLVLAIVVAIVGAGGCGQTPQLGNEQALAAADALWTSVTARNSELLESSAKRIEQLHDAAELPDDAFNSLTSVIALARSGKWDEARKSLKSLVRGQRPAPART